MNYAHNDPEKIIFPQKADMLRERWSFPAESGNSVNLGENKGINNRGEEVPHKSTLKKIKPEKECNTLTTSLLITHPKL